MDATLIRTDRHTGEKLLISNELQTFNYGRQRVLHQVGLKHLQFTTKSLTVWWLSRLR
jgi:hypothetical protein